MVAQSAFRLPGGLRVVPPATIWLAAGGALMLAGLWFESSPLARAPAPDPARLAGAGHVMHWYWVPLVVIAGLLIWWEGGEKELFRRYLPFLVVTYALARTLGAILTAPGVREGAAAFPAVPVAVTFAFVLSLLHRAPATRWLVVAADWVFAAVVWATVESARTALPDLLGALGLALAVFPLALRPPSQRTQLAFGALPAFRKYELFAMRWKAAAEVLNRELRSETSNTESGIEVLDVGCGYGELGCFVTVPAVRMHGIEWEEDRASQARRRGCTIDRLDIETGPLPYQPERFEAVVISHCLEHLGDPAATLSEADRVLRPGGLLVLEVPIKPPGLDWIPRVKHEQRVRERGRVPGETCRFWTMRSFLSFVSASLPSYATLEARGFRVISARDSLPLEDWRWFYRVNTWLGRVIPSLTPEVIVVLRKPGGAQPAGTDRASA